MSDNIIEYIQGNKNIFQSGSMQVNVYGPAPAEASAPAPAAEPVDVQEPHPADDGAAASQPAAAAAATDETPRDATECSLFETDGNGRLSVRPGHREAARLLQYLHRCEDNLAEGVDEAQVAQLLDGLFAPSACRQQLLDDLNNNRRWKKAVGMLLGRLAECGLYRKATDREYAALLAIDGIDLKSAERYVNMGRHNEEQLGYIDRLTAVAEKGEGRE